MWQNTKSKSVCQIQELVKCYLFLIFTSFGWIHPFMSKPIINTSTKVQTNDWDTFYVLVPEGKT